MDMQIDLLLQYTDLLIHLDLKVVTTGLDLTFELVHFLTLHNYRTLT